MKRMLIATIVALAIAGAASAQAGNAPRSQDGQQPPQFQALQQTTVTGKLEWSDGTIALRSGSTLYYVPKVRQLVGFAKDLQEGSSVTVTGYERKIPYSPNSFLMPTKLSFNGKDYEFAFGRGFAGRGPGAGGRMGTFGMGGYGRGMMGQGPCYGDWDGDGVREGAGPRW